MNAEPDKPADAGQAAGPRIRQIPLWAPAVLMALIVLGIWTPNLVRPPPPAWTVYSNPKGDIRRVVLADKSLLRLNGASAVRIVYEDRDRRADMGQAEAAFAIMPSARRPFLIDSGDRQVRMSEGELNILRQTAPTGARTVLTVRRGQATIYAKDGGGAAVVAGPGQEVTWIDGMGGPVSRAVNAANAFAWESHRLAYDHAPLSEVVADLNRYVVRPIRIGEPKLGVLPYTGVLALEGEDEMLRKLAAALPIEARRSAAQIVLQTPQPKVMKKKRTNLLVQSLLKLNRPSPLPRPKPLTPPQIHPLPQPPPRLLPKPAPTPQPKAAP